MPIILRKMQENDAHKVSVLARDIMPYPWCETVFRSCFLECYHNFVLEEAGHLIGFVVSKIEHEACWILNLGVAKVHQRRHLARRLMRVILKQPCSTFWLEVRASNAAALWLYASHGFVEVARRSGYYPGHKAREDAVVMRCEVHRDTLAD